MRDGIRIKKEQQALADIERAVRALAFNAGLSTEDVETMAAVHVAAHHRDPAIRRLRRVEALAELAGAFVQRTAGFTIIDSGQPAEALVAAFGEKLGGALLAAGFNDLDQVALADDAALLAIDGIGAASLAKIRAPLAVAADDDTPEA